MERVRRLTEGGSAANEQLTVAVAGVLLVLLAVEGATLFGVRQLLTVHAFVGMLLIPVVLLKLASTGWRMLSYYRGADEYVRRGPPPLLLRAVVAPLVILSTIVLFGTGVVLLVRDQTDGTVVGLHKASFVVWLGAMSVHVLAHLPAMVRGLGARTRGVSLRLAVVASALLAGLVVASATLPAAERLQDRATARFGLGDDR
jgi:hypothetical protein